MMIYGSLLYFNREPWPLDGIKFETLKERNAKRNPEDLEIDFGMDILLSFVSYVVSSIFYVLFAYFHSLPYPKGLRLSAPKITV